VTFLEAVLFSAISPLLPYFVKEFGLSNTGAGLLAAACPIGVLVAALPSIAVVRAVGKKGIVVVSLVLLCLSSAAFALAEVAAALFVARLLQGVGSAFAYTGALAWLTQAMEGRQKAETIGIAFSASFLGTLLGPLVGAFAASTGLTPAFLVIAALTGGLAALAALIPSPAASGSQRTTSFRGLGQRPVIVAVSLLGLIGALIGALTVLASLHFDEIGWSATAIAIVFAAASVITAISAPRAGRLADRAGRVLPMRVGSAIAAASAVVLAIDANDWLYAVIVVVALTAFGTQWAPTFALVDDAAERLGQDAASAFGLTNASWAPGYAVGAVAAPALAAAASDELVFLLMAAICSISAITLSSTLFEPRRSG
jgi:MFS family permease